MFLMSGHTMIYLLTPHIGQPSQTSLLQEESTMGHGQSITGAHFLMMLLMKKSLSCLPIAKRIAPKPHSVKILNQVQ